MKIKQLNLDCFKCQGPLNNGRELVKIMKEAAYSEGAKIIGSRVQNYPRYGLTAVVFLAESHVLVSTYPEIDYAIVEVFMCNDQMDPKRVGHLILEYLKPKQVASKSFFHTIPSGR